jgi:hypothetical protein
VPLLAGIGLGTATWFTLLSTAMTLVRRLARPRVPPRHHRHLRPRPDRLRHHPGLADRCRRLAVDTAGRTSGPAEQDRNGQLGPQPKSRPVATATPAARCHHQPPAARIRQTPVPSS